jgi:hypothetical protein
MPISAIAQHLKVRDKMIVKGSCQLGLGKEILSASVQLVMTRFASGGLSALACSGRVRHALARYCRGRARLDQRHSRCAGLSPGSTEWKHLIKNWQIPAAT